MLSLVIAARNRIRTPAALAGCKNNMQYIRTIQNHHTFSENEAESFMEENEFIKNKKLVSISPGGYKGFYVMGVCKYIKKHYDLTDYIFSGASAGAWNSLLMCFTRDIQEIESKIIDSALQEVNTINRLENMMKSRLIHEFKKDDFDLRKLFIGVTTFEHCTPNTTIFNGFESLEDAVNCCIASSHIPLITGGLTNVYRNICSFDGGFSKYPYLNITKSALHITPDIWKPVLHASSVSLNICDYTTLFCKDKFIFHKMIEQGYADSFLNKKQLDSVFMQIA